MTLFLNILVLAAFAGLVGTAVTAWHCMKLTRGEADDPAAFRKWSRGLAAALAVFLICGGLYMLLGRVTGADA